MIYRFFSKYTTFFFTGKLKNIEGIAKSTEDDVNIDNIAEIAKSTTEDYHFTPSQIRAVKKAPKPKTIPQGKLFFIQVCCTKCGPGSSSVFRISSTVLQRFLDDSQEKKMIDLISMLMRAQESFGLNKKV